MTKRSGFNAGDLRSYARLMTEIEALDRKLAASEQP